MFTSWYLDELENLGDDNTEPLFKVKTSDRLGLKPLSN